MKLTVAICQFPTSSDINSNFDFVSTCMHKAKDQCADVAHFLKLAYPVMQVLIQSRIKDWRTHLSRAFERLPAFIKDIGINVNSALTATDWHEKLEIVKTVFIAYQNYITSHTVFPEIDLSGIDLNNSDYVHELIWAERLGAWEKPDWREWIIRCTEKSVRDGHPPESFWVYSLWGVD